MNQVSSGRVAYDSPLVEGVFLKRYKRFFADVQLADGTVVVAHCPNTGSMKGLNIPGVPCRISPSTNPKRKLKWTLEQMCIGGDWAMVHTGRPNKIVEQALRAGLVPELAGYDAIQPEQKYGEQNSRIDLRLLKGGQLMPGEAPRKRKGVVLQPAEAACFVEIKNVTLVEGGNATFPDAVTSRGAKHLEELAWVAGQGHRAVLFFHVGHTGGQTVAAAREIDPHYATTLDRVVQQGVEVLAYGCRMDREGVWLAERVPVRL